MKILIGYDGSQNSIAMIDDLKLAGLPSDTEALVMSVAEMWLVPPPSYGLAQTDYVESFQLDVRLAKEIAEKGSTQLKAHFPTWKVTTESTIGSPARELLKKASMFHPDLIVVGSQGLSAIGRFLLGSVSQKVVTEAHSSVRIARGRLQETNEPARIIIGADGSPESNEAIRSVASRKWPRGTEVVLLAATGKILVNEYKAMIGASLPENTSTEVQTQQHDELTNIKRVLEEALEAQLRAQGLFVSTIIKEGDPRKVLLEEAEKWGADAIFIGSRGFSKIKRLVLGSVSTAISARAHCSVEVVRLTEKNQNPL
ncbi:MAG: Universal stress protein UspA-like nucleotide-binding protein [bacterium]|nr:MAG: Universal stress protein UspA-like nucleotide-binding protein [bacterium]